MSCMALQEEIERDWRNYLATDPEMKKIMEAIEGKEV